MQSKNKSISDQIFNVVLASAGLTSKQVAQKLNAKRTRRGLAPVPGPSVRGRLSELAATSSVYTEAGKNGVVYY